MLDVGINLPDRLRMPRRPPETRSLLFPLALVLAAGALACSTDNDVTPTTTRTTEAPGAEDGVPTGLWGGDGIILRVTETIATVEYECAAGTITEPLRTDPDGRFEAEGLHSYLSGGPVDISPAPERKPLRALYTGSTDGSSMSLTVTLTKTDEEVGRFELTHGHEPHLNRCL